MITKESVFIKPTKENIEKHKKKFAPKLLKRLQEEEKEYHLVLNRPINTDEEIIEKRFPFYFEGEFANHSLDHLDIDFNIYELIDKINKRETEHSLTIFLDKDKHYIDTWHIQGNDALAVRIPIKEELHLATRKDVAYAIFIHNHPYAIPAKTDDGDEHMNFRRVCNFAIGGVTVLDAITVTPFDCYSRATAEKDKSLVQTIKPIIFDEAISDFMHDNYYEFWHYLFTLDSGIHPHSFSKEEQEEVEKCLQEIDKNIKRELF